MWAVTCDPGIDDAVALVTAAGEPGLDLAAIVAAAGNVPAGTAWRNAVGMAALLGLDVPVGLGAETSLDGTAITRGPTSHGADGLGGLAHRLPLHRGAPPNGAALIRGSVVATGPLTEVARALRSGHPVDRVVWMGGSVGWAEGAAAVGKEFNAGADPPAVDAVLAAGVAVHVVPIEITMQVPFGDDDLAPWRTASPVARLCSELVARRKGGGTGPVLLHDPLAVVAAVAPEMFRWEEHALRCLPGGSLVDAEEGVGGRARVAVAVDARPVRARVVATVAGVPG